MPSIFLTGFMGTGKSTVGRMLAVRLGCPFHDLDSAIETAAGRTIREIFSQEGEEAFRRYEQDALRILSGTGLQVVATGGGAVLDPENRALMRTLGVIINLAAPVETILERVAGDASRPLLVDRSKEQVAALLSTRASAYADADLHVDTSGKGPASVVDEIVAYLRREGWK